LEAILTHLSDPEEKELVKNELSSRYYNYYLYLALPPEGEPLELSTQKTEAVSSQEDMPATGAPSLEFLALKEELAEIAQVAPPQLTPPTPPDTAANLTEKSTEEAPKKKFCFIATATYGTPLAPEVIILQNFRDDYLAPHALGEKFIRAYYRCSPWFARQISCRPALKLLAEWLLAPIILVIKRNFR
jgi:hypothetical protein